MPANPPERKLSRAQLRQIAQRRRDDVDVQTLLWEIKRLHDVIVQCHGTIAALDRRNTDPGRGARAFQALKALAEEPAVIDTLAPPKSRDPALPDLSAPRYRKLERQPVTGYAQRRVEQVQEEAELSEREAKRRARERR